MCQAVGPPGDPTVADLEDATDGHVDNPAAKRHLVDPLVHDHVPGHDLMTRARPAKPLHGMCPRTSYICVSESERCTARVRQPKVDEARVDKLEHAAVEALARLDCHSTRRPVRARAITRRWISEITSKIFRSISGVRRVSITYMTCGYVLSPVHREQSDLGLSGQELGTEAGQK